MDNKEKLKEVFWNQKSRYSPARVPSYEQRIDRLNRLDKMLRKHHQKIIETVRLDFGTRSDDQGFISEIYSPLDLIKKVKKNLKKWMKPEKKSSGFLTLTGQKTYQINEPLGVIGIMSPFNAPVSLALDPAIEALAAGNSVIIKISESVPHTAELMQKLITQYFDQSEMTVVTGGVEISKAFANLPWDKFFFTGGSEVGKKILEANAKHLTPSILELGGKSPCIILEDADIKTAAQKIGKIRLMNAGQVCISGDYVFAPDKLLNEFIEHLISEVEDAFPTILENPLYTSIINKSEYERILSYIDEARQHSCDIIEVNPAKEPLPDPKTRKIPLYLVINPPKDIQVSKKEIFGPILSIFTYHNLEDIIEQINNNHKPLALYVFGKNQKNINKVVENTSSGGVTINDLMMHANAKDMGFGGVGYSGMGRYKGGKVGFYAFTNPKTVFKQGMIGKFTNSFLPPYKADKTRKMIRSQVSIK